MNGPGVQICRAAVTDAGRLHGNQFVLRLLKGAKDIQRKPAAPTGLKGTTLVGLQRGDGLDFGTYDRRPRVALLQEKLNEKMMAGLTADGMFGAKTEQILREFQKSMEIPSSHVVDPITANLLMTESTPDRPGKDVPQDDNKRVQSAGISLNEAAEQLKKVAGRHLSAGTKIGQGEGKAGNIGGSLMQAGEEMYKSAILLAKVGKLLSMGSLVQIKEAGPVMEQSGAALMKAGQRLNEAAETMASTKYRAYKVAAMSFGPLAAVVESAGQNLKLSGQQLKRYAPPDIPGKEIGDPLVGLKQGDGIDFGTWDRRPRVEELQMLLNDQEVGAVAIDGMFGEDTSSALYLVQMAHHIKLANRVDRATAQALRKGPKPELPVSGDPLSIAGKHLEIAGKLLFNAEGILLAGALAIRSGPGPADSEASERLQKASKDLAETGKELDKAGKSLKGSEKAE